MSLRWKLFLPLLSFAVTVTALAVWFSSRSAGTSHSVWTLIVTAAVLLALTWLAVDFLVRKPFSNLVRAVSDPKLDAIGARRADELKALAERIGELQAGLRDQQSLLRREADERKRVEESLHESEQRYALAVRGANDGLWEWDLKSDAMYFSPRWKSMLGFAEYEMSDSVAAWRQCVHPVDRAQVEKALQAHLSGSTVRFESQHRLLHKDATHRWILSRASAIRHASGAAYRIVGLDTDITPFKRMEEVLAHVAEGTSGVTGENFFRALVRHFAAILEVREVFITECVDTPPTRVRALACWDRDRFIDEEYELAPTPCKRVIEEGVPYFIPEGLADLFPNELPYGFNSYLGIPIFSRRQKVLGHLVFKDEKPMSESIMLDSVYRIFTSRAGAEMERIFEKRLMLQMARELSNLTDDERLVLLVKSFAAFTGAKEAFVTECMDDPVTRVRALVYWNDGEVMHNVEYDLAGNPCEQVHGAGELLYYPRAVAARWPLEQPLNRESYLGVPCHDSTGKTIGHIACFDTKPMPEGMPDAEIIQFMAERAAALLQRRRA